MYRIDPERIDLVEAFKSKPFGPHAPEVKRMLNRLRSGTMRDRWVLVCIERHRRWVLGRLSGQRSTPIELERGVEFTNLAQAEWEVFKRRWQAHTGRSLVGRVQDPTYDAALGAGRR
jgi:hypothetical protein